MSQADRSQGTCGGAVWSSPDDLKRQVLRYWERGVLLRSVLAGGAGAGFPLRLVLKGPASADLTERFEAVRAWSAALDRANHIRIERREIMHRIQGTQRIPQEAWVDSFDEAVAWIGKRDEVAAFETVLRLTRERCPLLLPWLEKRLLQAAALAKEWERLMEVVLWLKAHPRPGIYLRQVDIPGLHTKFIETHVGVLTELLDLALQPEAIENGATGVRRFALRYGFLEKPELIRFRVLDDRLSLLPGPIRPDIALDAESFAKLELPVRLVFVTENETNYLAFPPVNDAIVIFGAGYGWEALAKAQWLSTCQIHYWGDIDTHGFAILDSFRSRFPTARSFLMDYPTLKAHEALWGHEPEPVVRDLPRLTPAERLLYDGLRDNRYHPQVRLEQEKIEYSLVLRASEQAQRPTNDPTQLR